MKIVVEYFALRCREIEIDDKFRNCFNGLADEAFDEIDRVLESSDKEYTGMHSIERVEDAVTGVCIY